MHKKYVCNWGSIDQRKERFLIKARLAHGDRFLYDKVEYVDVKTKVVITCREHGDFLITPASHASGWKSGCRKCGGLSPARSLSQEDFLERVRKIHGQRYDYSKTLYKRASEKVVIACHNHGDFHISPRSHMAGHGCQKCGAEKVMDSITKTTKEFVTEAAIKHKGKYDYSRVKYVNGATHVEIICPIHGPFSTPASGHLFGKECYKCSRKTASSKMFSSTKDFIKSARKIYERQFDYSLVDYKNCMAPVKIICKEHGEFLLSPKRHLGGAGCRLCWHDKCHGFLKERFVNSCKKTGRVPFLYVIQMSDAEESFLKIGVTSKTLATRFPRNPYQITPITQWFDSPDETWTLERRLHKMFKGDKYTPKKSFAGKTECYRLETLPKLLAEIPTPKIGDGKKNTDSEQKD